MSENLKLKESYLFILPWSLSSLGGVNQVVENLYRQMKLNGKYDPIIMVNSWSDTKIRKENIIGIDHYFFRFRSPWNSLRKLYNIAALLLEGFGTVWRLNAFVKINKISVINIHYCSLFGLTISLMKLLRIFKGNFILSFHGKDLLSAKKSHGIERFLWKIMFKSADLIVTCSDSLKTELYEFDKSIFGKIKTIHNGVTSIDLFDDEFNSNANELMGSKFILNVATLEHKKGQDVLLRAFKKIEHQFVDISLLLIGRPGGAEDEIKKLINSLGLSKRVYLYEGLAHAEVLAFIKKSMVFVLPSRYEPFGIVVLEAGAFAVPVIASNVGGVREILSHDVTGILCEPEDINVLADELKKLLEKPEERNRLGHNLRNHVLDKFSWEKTCEKYLESFRLHY